jgi:hypothetical protein
MIKRRFLLGIIWSLVLFLGVGARELMAGEPTKPEFTLKLMGINRTLDPWKLYEEWAQSVEKRTNGRVKFELTSLPELGLGGAETIRVIKTGVVDVAEVYGGYVAGELPMLEILEIPGIFPDPETAQKAILAWKPYEAKILDERANAVLLAMAVYPDQAIFSKRPVRKLEDFKGLKTRVHSVALASLVAGLAGEPLTGRLRRGLYRPGARHAGCGYLWDQTGFRSALVRSVQIPSGPDFYASACRLGHQQEYLETITAGSSGRPQGGSRGHR